jgi:chromosomal replication initiator protein
MPPAPPPAPEPVAPVPALAETLPAVPGRITVRLVLETTAEHFGTTVEALVSDSRKQPLCHRRQIAMYVAHRLTGRSLPFIADKIGGRDHTTILHGIRAVKTLLDAGDAETVAAVNVIIEKLTGGAA